MTARSFARPLALLFAGALALLATLRAPSPALAQIDMDRAGVLDIKDDHEKSLFLQLQCVCGCPRESIGTCTCGQSTGYRAEARALMAKGLSDEEIKTEWEHRYGPGSLMVPRNDGTNRFLYILPLVTILAMAGFAVQLLRRYRSRADLKASEVPAPAPGQKRDEYDDKLDEELKQLDNE